MKRRFLTWIAALTVVFLVPALGDTTLVLIDGRALRGTDVQRDGGIYILTLETGEQIALPSDLVETVRIERSADEERDARDADGQPETLAGSRPSGGLPGFRQGTVETLAGTPPPGGPSGLRSAKPETLAGEPARLPSRSEQLEVLGPPSKFQNAIVDNRWVPETDWDMDPVKNNNFAPSTWSKGVIDPTWEPESAWDKDEDVLAPSQSKWKQAPIDSSWAPTDGFATSVSRR